MIQLIIQLQLKVQIKMGRLRKNKYNYVLVLGGGGSYFADSLWGLFVEIMKHRLFHFKRGEGWVD